MIGFSLPSVDETKSASRRALQDRAAEPKELWRIDQETGAQIVLFRRGFAHFDSAGPQMVWPFAKSGSTPSVRSENKSGTAHARCNAFYAPE
jgi:hypothetical protein